MSENKNPRRFTILLYDLDLADKIDKEIHKQEIRNFQDAYRDIFILGFEQFKKGGKKL